MIYTYIPYAPSECEKNIGCAYNKFMEILPNDDDWGCFLDHDAMFTTSDWYHQLNEIVVKNPTVGAFGGRTNRIAKKYQLVGNIDPHNHDIKYHRQIGGYLQQTYYHDTSCVSRKTRPRGFGGVFILLKKSAWKTIHGFKKTGFTGVDDDLRLRLHHAKIPFHIMNGLYVYHWYRADNPYSHGHKRIVKINKTYQKHNKENFELNKVFLY